MQRNVVVSNALRNSLSLSSTTVLVIHKLLSFITQTTMESDSTVKLSKERLETLLFKEKKTRRAMVRKRGKFIEKINELKERLATAEAEIVEHNRRVAMFEEEIRRNPSPTF